MRRVGMLGLGFAGTMLLFAADAYGWGWPTHQNITEQVARQHGITDSATISLLRSESIWNDTSWDINNSANCHYYSEDGLGTWGMTEEYNPFYDDGPQTIQNGDHIFDVYNWDHSLSPTGRDCDDAQRFFSVYGIYASTTCNYISCTKNSDCPGQVVASGPASGCSDASCGISANSCSACGIFGCSGTGHCKFYDDSKNCWGSCRFASPTSLTVSGTGNYSGALETLGTDQCWSGAPSWPVPTANKTTCTLPLQFLARGAHYIEDVSQPWHTVAWANASQPANHTSYEAWVDSKWSDTSMNLTGWASSGSYYWTDYNNYTRCSGWNTGSSYCNGTTTSLSSMSYYDITNDLAHITTQFQKFVNDNRGVTTCQDTGVPVTTYGSNYTNSINGHYTSCYQDNPWVTQWVVWYGARALSAANHKAAPTFFP